MTKIFECKGYANRLGPRGFHDAPALLLVSKRRRKILQLQLLVLLRRPDCTAIGSKYCSLLNGALRLLLWHRQVLVDYRMAGLYCAQAVSPELGNLPNESQLASAFGGGFVQSEQPEANWNPEPGGVSPLGNGHTLPLAPQNRNAKGRGRMYRVGWHRGNMPMNRLCKPLDRRL